MEFVSTILLGVLVSLIAAELYAHAPSVAEWMIDCAVRRLPKLEQARFREQWLADNRDFAGNLQKAAHAIGCVLGASAVARVLRKAQSIPTSIQKRNTKYRYEAFKAFAETYRRARLEHAEIAEQKIDKWFEKIGEWDRRRTCEKILNTLLEGRGLAFDRTQFDQAYAESRHVIKELLDKEESKVTDDELEVFARMLARMLKSR